MDEQGMSASSGNLPLDHCDERVLCDRKITMAIIPRQYDSSGSAGIATKQHKPSGGAPSPPGLKAKNNANMHQRQKDRKPNSRQQKKGILRYGATTLHMGR